eukprot:2121582-Ditylum_brightwellii.AAC.1
MSEQAISIENKVLKMVEEHNVVIKSTIKSKPSARFFVNTMKELIDTKKISLELPCGMKGRLVPHNSVMI